MTASSFLDNKELTSITTALKRASQLARETAIATNTSLIIMQDGKIVKIPADKLKAEKQITQED